MKYQFLIWYILLLQFFYASAGVIGMIRWFWLKKEKILINLKLRESFKFPSSQNSVSECVTRVSRID